MSGANINWIDCHSHILPSIDRDSIRTLQESEQLFRMMNSCGTYALCLTPHYNPTAENISKFIIRRGNGIQSFNSFKDKYSTKVFYGSEVYFDPSLFYNEDLMPLCINNKNHLLIEFHCSERFANNIFNDLNRLITSYKIVPVIAHFERYDYLVKNAATVLELIDMGCLIQMNLDALFGSFFKVNRMLSFIEKGMVHILGSDCHYGENYIKIYHKSMTLLNKACGPEIFDVFFKNSKNIILGF